MSQLENAEQYLARALKRLQTAVEQRLSHPADGSRGSEPAMAEVSTERDQLARDVNQLREQCNRLSAALNEAQHDNRSLREMSGHVARRLDTSIAELDRLLGS